MNGDHEHDRFLRVEDSNLVFGCINPFCCHGNVGLPNVVRIPMETRTVSIKVVSHKDRHLKLEVTLKEQVGDNVKGKMFTLDFADNLWECKVRFGKFLERLKTNE